MRRAFLLAVFVAVASALSAQVSFGVKVGINAVPRDELFEDFWDESYCGFQVGPLMKVTIPDMGFGFEIGALLNQITVDDENLRVKQRSLAVPVNVRFYPLRGVPLFAFAGPQLDLNLSRKFSANEALRELSSHDALVSTNVGLGLTILNFQLTANYSISLGKRRDVTLNGALSDTKEVLFGNARASTWQFGAAFFF